MANVNIRVDDNLKKEAESVLSEIGLSMSAATNIFYKQIVRTGGIPFELKVDPFYSKSNMDELERRAKAIETGKAKLTEHDLIEVADD